MLDWLTSNNFAVGTISAVLLGAILATLRRVPLAVGTWLLRLSTSTITVTNADESFFWLSQWLDTISNGSFRHVGVHVSSEKVSRSVFVPATGYHLTWWGRMPILLQKTVQINAVSQRNFGSREPYEKITVWLPTRNANAVRELLAESKQCAVRPTKGDLDIYVSSYGSWRLVARTSGRPASTVFFDGLSDLLEDATKFLDSRSWYEKRGIPWQRGWLFWGKPGGGKTSVAKAIATELGLDIYILDVMEPEFRDARLQELMTTLPPRSIVLIEDCDRVFRHEAVKVSMSGVLNAIDGVLSAAGRLLIMTTNNRNVIGKDIMRPGRIDLSVEFPPPSGKQVVRFLRSVYGPEIPTRVGEQWEEIGQPLQMAQIQQAALSHPECADDALKELLP